MEELTREFRTSERTRWEEKGWEEQMDGAKGEREFVSITYRLKLIIGQ